MFMCMLHDKLEKITKYQNVYVNVTWYLKGKRNYQNVYVNVTWYLKGKRNYQNVYVNVTW
jgi:hypothetical protein